MRRWISILLPLLGLALFAVIVMRTGPERIVDVFRAVDPRRLALSPLLVGVILVLRGYRWRYLMHGAGLDYPLGRSVVVWSIGFFASSVTPAKAGDAVRAFYVRDETGCSMGQAFVGVFIDRLWDLLFVMVAGMATVLLFSRFYIEIPSTWILLAAVIAIAATAYVLLNRNVVRRILRPIFDLLVPAQYKDRFSLNFHTFYDSLQSVLVNHRRHVGALVLTLMCWGAIFLLACYIAWLLEIVVPFRYILLIMPIVTLVELVPVSISGLGTRDATVIYFFSVVGAGRAEAVGFSLAYLLIGTYLTALVGFLYWLRHPVRFGGE